MTKALRTISEAHSEHYMMEFDYSLKQMCYY